MQNIPVPETPFAEVLHAAQSGENEISWQKNTPVTQAERDNARRIKKMLVYTQPVPLVLTVIVYFALPNIFLHNGELLLPAVLPLVAYDVIAPLFTLWLIKRYNRVLDLPAHEPQAATYSVRFKNRGKDKKGLSVARSVGSNLNYAEFTLRDWQAVLPRAGEEDVRRLSQIIVRRLNGT
ncbi:Uncharacterised protein [Kingella potus]|uniref:Uncharacterized protein n=1 Tax=Kingella potus TaxID=265175 RepID=A0A377R002_9NEIS|nr:hypothetical protein [Kingella potus]UOP01553.1 hypothetical protein LVJ84_05035 [Kingella potus]STR00158.1 Uncharacterised protein [Kingella potus]